MKRPNAVQGDSTIEWRRQIKISSVGKEEAEYQGKMQPCRWIEIKVQTGHAKEGDIDAGPDPCGFIRCSSRKASSATP